MWGRGECPCEGWSVTQRLCAYLSLSLVLMNNLLNSLNLLCGQFVISLLVFVLWQASHSFPLVSILNPKHHYSVLDADLPWAHPGFWVGGGDL